MLVKVADAIGAQLDWMVAKCEGQALLDPNNNEWEYCWNLLGDNSGDYYSPSTNWTQGGPIVDKNPRISPTYDERFDSWFAYKQSPALYGKQSFLVSAMRAYVASKLDTEIEIPNSLFKG